MSKIDDSTPPLHPAHYVLAILLSYAITPVHLLVGSWFLTKFWAMFIERQYGPGPTTMSWVGALAISAIFRYRSGKRDADVERTPITALIERILFNYISWILMAGVLVLAASLLGWR
jgi:hypothetical protein